MKPQTIIAVVLAIVMTACVLFWVLPGKPPRGRSNNHPVQSVELTATNANGETFTVRMGAMIINGTNVLTNSNVKITFQPKDNK